jgi:hypothetical protein
VYECKPLASGVSWPAWAREMAEEEEVARDARRPQAKAGRCRLTLRNPS